MIGRQAAARMKLLQQRVWGRISFPGHKFEERAIGNCGISSCDRCRALCADPCAHATFAFLVNRRVGGRNVPLDGHRFTHLSADPRPSP